MLYLSWPSTPTVPEGSIVIIHRTKVKIFNITYYGFWFLASQVCQTKETKKERKNKARFFFNVFRFGRRILLSEHETFIRTIRTTRVAKTKASIGWWNTARRKWIRLNFPLSNGANRRLNLKSSHGPFPRSQNFKEETNKMDSEYLRTHQSIGLRKFHHFIIYNPALIYVA